MYTKESVTPLCVSCCIYHKNDIHDLFISKDVIGKNTVNRELTQLRKPPVVPKSSEIDLSSLQS